MADNGDPWQRMERNEPRQQIRDDRPWGGTEEQRREGNGDAWAGMSRVEGKTDKRDRDR